MAHPARSSPIAGSSQDQPKVAVAASPTRTAPAWAAHIRFCRPSPLVASEFSCWPRRCLARPRSGMTTRLAANRRPRRTPIPPGCAQPGGIGVRRGRLFAASLVVMPLLGRAKQRLGQQLNSEATSGEGLQNLMCAAQAGAVLVGLAATATLGWSWLDPAIGLLLAGWAIYEGIEAWRGEDCC